jgi:hypothetical protein
METNYKNNPRIYSLDNATKLHETLVLQDCNCQPHYRGERMLGWDIRAGIFRDNNNDRFLIGLEGRKAEKHAIDLFKDSMIEKFGDNIFKKESREGKYGSYWDLVCQAQHAGIKTTITDWSASIITALYFATEFSSIPEEENADAQLWHFATPKGMIFSDNLEVFDELDPMDMKNAIMFNPAHFINNIEERPQEQRMYQQEGRFFMCETKHAHVAVNKLHWKSMTRYIIPANCKRSIREELNAKGINKESMHLQENIELDSLSREINKEIRITFQRKDS